MTNASYVLPIRSVSLEGLDELTAYLASLNVAQLIVVDGSPSGVFAAHAQRWDGLRIQHVAPLPVLPGENGKVCGVVAGLALAQHDKIVVADDDVRYDADSLERIVALLDDHEVVRPQNYFDPVPWHAVVDTSRTLLNRVTGGDWPGTLAVRKSALPSYGYRRDVLFENLELVRTVVARGGRECVAADLFVRRLPPTTQHYLSQRVRQAYDEFARPIRLAAALAIIPCTFACVAGRRWDVLASAAGLAIVAAEAGRRSGGGRRRFAPLSSLCAPLWLLERGVCAWAAACVRLSGGVRYGSARIVDAATPAHRLHEAKAA